MATPRQHLETRLLQLPGLRIDRWKNSDLVCLFHNDREIAHFQDEAVLDIRLTPALIRDERLSRAVSARYHPKRSPRSRWICVAFDRPEGIDQVVHLVERACNGPG